MVTWVPLVPVRATLNSWLTPLAPGLGVPAPPVRIVSRGAAATIKFETGRDPDEIAGLADVTYEETDLAAALASGTFETSGMVIAPSVFCRAPRLYVGRSEELMLIYPVLRSTLAAAEVFGGAAKSQAVADLLGRTRAAVLEATDGRLTTGEIARRLEVSPASASQHTAVLREAGLISSHRQGKTVHHTITSLGKALLDGHF